MIYFEFEASDGVFLAVGVRCCSVRVQLHCWHVGFAVFLSMSVSG